MSERSAGASIKGYYYQFISSVINILKQSDDSVKVTVEGVEDLDISKIDSNKLYQHNSNELYQYKCHESKPYNNSLVAKPIGIMFNHYVNNMGESNEYKLIIHLGESLPELTIDRLSEILSLEGAKKYVDQGLKIHCDDKKKVQEFAAKFSWVKTERYDDLEKEAVNLIQQSFRVSEEEAMAVFLSNAIKEINMLGIKPTVEERTLTPKTFKESLLRKKETSDMAYIYRTRGEEKAKKVIVKYLEALNVKHNNHDKVIYLPSHSVTRPENLILELVKRHYYKGNKSDYRPITVIAEDSTKLKSGIFSILKKSNEIILMNDGYEEYEFNADIFSLDPFTESKPLSGKVNNVNFNFRLISASTYKRESKKINFKNPIMICLGDECPEIISKFEKVINLKLFSDESIMSIVGGKHG